MVAQCVKYKIVDGIVFEKMLYGGLSNIRAYEKETNELNVFPVPDGDTGLNMRRTLQYGVEVAHTNANLDEYLKEFSHGTLLGARGNSGVILSQLFRGLCTGLAGHKSTDAVSLAKAIKEGCDLAYSTVMKPVEGTILTVVREGVGNTSARINENTSVYEMLGIYIDEMRKTLAKTPELLPVLKEAGVVDSGGYGYIRIFEGMLKALDGEISETPDDLPLEVVKNDVQTLLNDDFIDADSEFNFGYCMEFMLQLLNKKRPVEAFNRDDFTESIGKYGDSIVVVQGDNRVKVHIHTKQPETIIAHSREYGEFISLKLDNMQMQHNEFVSGKKQREKPRKQLALLAVGDGEGFRETFLGQGCDLVIDGGRMMNTSVKDFLDAFARLNADKVIVFPNDKNVFYAVKQAADMFKGSEIEIIPTENMVQGYFALASDIPDDDDIQNRIRLMNEGIRDLTTIAVARASREKVLGGVKYNVGEYAAFLNGQLLLSNPNAVNAFIEAFKRSGVENDSEQLIVFTGRNLPEDSDIEEKLSEAFPQLEINIIDGRQSANELIIGVI